MVPPRGLDPAPTRTSSTIGLIGVYLVARLWQLAMLGPPIVTPDTGGYRLPAQAGLFELDLVSFTGHAIRPWPLTLLYAIGPSDTARVWLQMAVATVAWTTLAVAIGTRTRWHLAAAATTLALALTPGISGWDAVLLGESLLVSFAALAVAGVVFLRRGQRGLGWALAVGATAFLVVCRPVFAPLALLVAVVVAVRPRHEPAPRFALHAILSAGLLVTIVYAVVHNAEIDRQWGRGIGEPDLRGRTVQQFSILAWSPLGERLIDRMIDDGAPRCLMPPRERSTGAWEWWQAQRVDCPAGLRWVSDNFTGWMVARLATHPSDAREYFRMALSSASRERTDGASSLPSPMLPVVSLLFFGNNTNDALIGLGVATMTFAVVRRRRPAWPTVGLVAAGAGGLVLTALLSALDVERVGLSAAVLLRLGLLLCCLDVAAGDQPLATDRKGDTAGDNKQATSVTCSA